MAAAMAPGAVAARVRVPALVLARAPEQVQGRVLASVLGARLATALTEGRALVPARALALREPPAQVRVMAPVPARPKSTSAAWQFALAPSANGRSQG